MKYYLILLYFVNITSDHYIRLILCKKERKNSSCLRNGKRAVCNLANETYYEPCSSRDRFSSRWTPSPRDSPISNQSFVLFWSLKFTVERTGSSKESSLFFLWTKESFAVRYCPSKKSTLFSSRRGLACFEMQPQDSEVFEADFQVHLVLCCR